MIKYLCSTKILVDAEVARVMAQVLTLGCGRSREEAKRNRGTIEFVPSALEAQLNRKADEDRNPAKRTKWDTGVVASAGLAAAAAAGLVAARLAAAPGASTGNAFADLVAHRNREERGGGAAASATVTAPWVTPAAEDLLREKMLQHKREQALHVMNS